jgi:hypothetical protein
MTENDIDADPFEYARRQPNILRERAEKPTAAHMEAAANTIDKLLAEIDALNANRLEPDEAYAAADYLSAAQDGPFFGGVERAALAKLREQAGPDPDYSDA